MYRFNSYICNDVLQLLKKVNLIIIPMYMGPLWFIIYFDEQKCFINSPLHQLWQLLG